MPADSNCGLNLALSKCASLEKSEGCIVGAFFIVEGASKFMSA